MWVIRWSITMQLYVFYTTNTLLFLWQFVNIHRYCSSLIFILTCSSFSVSESVVRRMMIRKRQPSNEHLKNLSRQALSHRFSVTFYFWYPPIILLYPALCLLSVCTTLTNINYSWRYLTLTHSFYVFFHSW